MVGTLRLCEITFQTIGTAAAVRADYNNLKW